MEPPRSWAAHPNATLRAALAEYIGHGYQVQSLTENEATVIKLDRFSFPKFFLFSWLYPLARIGRRDEMVSLSISETGELVRKTLSARAERTDSN